MHFIAIGYPLITGLVGLAMGVYSEPQLGLNYCWVNDYPKHCGEVAADGPGSSGEECLSPKLAWVFAGMWIILAFISLVVNNLVIVIFVRHQTRRMQRRKINRSTTEPVAETLSLSSHGTDSKGLGYRVSHLETGDSRQTGGEGQQTKEDRQLSRLKLVRSQALLFVGAFTVCMFFPSLLRIKEAYADSYVEKMPANNYTLLLLQAITLPLQGFFNMLVYVRPKYLKRREVCPDGESRFVSFRRSIFGEKKERKSGESLSRILNIPQVSSEHAGEIVLNGESTPPNAKKEKTIHKGFAFKRLGRGMLSSLTASHGDFVGNIPDSERWGIVCEDDVVIDTPRRSSSKIYLPSTDKLSALDAIGEVGSDTIFGSSMTLEDQMDTAIAASTSRALAFAQPKQQRSGITNDRVQGQSSSEFTYEANTVADLLSYRMKDCVGTSESEDTPPTKPTKAESTTSHEVTTGALDSAEFSSTESSATDILSTGSQRWRIPDLPFDKNDSIPGTPKRYSSGLGAAEDVCAEIRESSDGPKQMLSEFMSSSLPLSVKHSDDETSVANASSIADRWNTPEPPKVDTTLETPQRTRSAHQTILAPEELVDEPHPISSNTSSEAVRSVHPFDSWRMPSSTAQSSYSRMRSCGSDSLDAPLTIPVRSNSEVERFESEVEEV
eukprot:scaffold10358_cov105-Cylindrotheca_fusiformis.AAC.2